MPKRLFGTAVYSLLLTSVAPAQDWAAIDRAAAEAVARWGVPGVVAGVVRDSDVVWMGAYGTRRAGSEDPVDSRTLFDLGSITKQFTAALAVMLAAEGTVDLDQPARDCLPDLHFPTARLEEQITLRDLLSHRTGIAANNLMFWTNGLSRSEVLQRARYLTVGGPFREHFEYHNVLYLAAGEALGAAASTTWDELVESRLLRPLHMTRTSVTRSRVTDTNNVAHPHVLTDQGWKPVPFIDLDNAAPSGAMVSSLDDMLRWAAALLGDQQILSEEMIAELWRPHVDIPANSVYRQVAPFADPLSYSLGFFRYRDSGHTVLEHGGQTDGMHSEILLMPEQRLGIVVLSNGLNMFLPQAIAYLVVDDLLGTPPGPRQDQLWSLWETWRPRMALVPTESLIQDTGPTPTESLDRLPGTYHSALYGEAIVRATSGHLTLEVLGRRGRLHASSETRFVPEWTDRFLTVSVQSVRFSLGAVPSADTLMLGGSSFRRVR